MVIIYSPTIPEALLPIITERVESVKTLFPGWCNRVSINYEHDNTENFVLACSSVYEYRFADILVYDAFFSDISWKESLFHEIMHMVLAPFSSKVQDVLEVFSVDERIVEYLNKD